MSTAIERMAADTTRTGAPFARNSTTSAEVLAIPAEWRGLYVALQNSGAERIGVRFGTAASVGVSLAERSTLTGAVLTPGSSPATEPHLTLGAGEEKRERIPLDATHLAHIASGATVLRLGLWTGSARR